MAIGAVVVVPVIEPFDIGDSMDSIDITAAREVLAAQPFSILLGAELLEFGAGVARLQLALREELLQQHGVAHGGLIAYLADNAIAFAAGSVAGATAVTAGLTLSLLRPGTGNFLLAEARVIRAGRSRVTCQCDVLASTGEQVDLIAVAQGDVMVGQ